MKKEVKWLGWWMQPLYSVKGPGGVPAIVMGTSLDHAFTMARACWPMALGWRCLGRVNSRDREKSTNKDHGWVVRITARKIEKE